jgi:glycosyltransferase involved in cell wall biosynthesis
LYKTTKKFNVKIVLVSAFYSEGMGYCENSLPKALASLGHEVHLITSNLNVYGNLPIYNETYKSFLGPADQGVSEFFVDGYTVHRLKSKLIFGYVYYSGLLTKIRRLSPDIIHSFAFESLQTFFLAYISLFLKFKLFTETHQHLSIVKPFLKQPKGNLFKKISYKLSRTFPGFIASFRIQKCYAITPDCSFVANKYYGVPNKKIMILPLGTDTELFCPSISVGEKEKRVKMRKEMKYSDLDILCIYTGRFSEDKNPLLLAKAIDSLATEGYSFHGIFIGDGSQRELIEANTNVKVIPFMKQRDLADYYRIADIAIWPTQESISMLDAASCELPLVVSDRIGEHDRIEGNGRVYIEGNLESLCDILKTLAIKEERIKLGIAGRKKMIDKYSWNGIAKVVEKDYLNSLEIN